MKDDMERVFFESMLYAMEGKSPSKAIEDSERRGTIAAVKSSLLPRITNHISVPKNILYEGVSDDMDWPERLGIENANNEQYTRRQYQIMGIKILGEDDDLFLSVQLPEGWTMSTTGHSMWNEVYDEKGRRRMNYFYKAAFYDRHAFTNFDHRYNYSIEPCDRYESDMDWQEREKGIWTLYLLDSKKEILKIDSAIPKDLEDARHVRDMLQTIGEKYMNENYPGWQDINAYWKD